MINFTDFFSPSHVYQGFLNAIVYFEINISERVRRVSTTLFLKDVVNEEEKIEKGSTSESSKIVVHDIYVSSNANDSTDLSRPKVCYWIP